MGIHDADVVVVPVTRLPDFRFNPVLNDLKKPWVLVDYCEFGWNDPMSSSYLWGNNRIQREDFQGDEWHKFDEFVVQNPPILMFQRELLEKDRTDWILPIEYVNHLPEFGIDTREEFNKRPLEVSFNFGRSHEYRMDLHGAIFSNAGRLGYDVVSQFDHVDKAIRDNAHLKWLTVHAPHYSRIDVREVQKFTRMSKITIVPGGCGFKTFRHGEVSADAIMAIPRNRLAWAYSWDHTNSVMVPEYGSHEAADDSCTVIQNALMSFDLYEIYCNAMTNARNYRFPEYLRRHVTGNIEKFL